MRPVKLSCLTTFMLIYLILLSSSIINSQPRRSINEKNGHNASIEYLIPVFENAQNESQSVWIIFLKAELKIVRDNYFVLDLPIAHGKRFNGLSSDSDSETSIGNLYAGFKIIRPNSPFTVDIGIRIPTASEENSLSLTTAIFTDIKCIEAFCPDNLIFQNILNYSTKRANELNGKFSIGPKIWIYTGNNDFDERLEINLNYEAKAFYLWENYYFGVGIAGLLRLTEEEFLGDDRTINFFEIEYAAELDRVRPEIEIHFPIDEDFGDILNLVIGLNLKYYFN